MNVCDINQNREFANSIADYINASIKESLESKKSFKLFTILDEVFKAVDEGETEPTKALGAATMVPQLFFEVLELEKGLNSGLAEQGFDIRIVKTLQKALAESNDPITLMAEVLNKTKIPTIEQMVNNNLAPSTSNAKIIERVVGTLKGFFDNVMFSFSMFNTTGRSVLKTTAYSVEKSNPNRVLEYNVLQNLLSIDNDTNKPFDKIEYSGHTGFKLKVIQEKNIIDPAKNIYPGETPGEGFITILVNNKGEYYYFNDEGNITTPDKGKLVYFPLKSTKQENIDKVIEGMIEKFKRLTQKEAAADPIMYANQLVAKTLEIKNQVNKEVQSLKEIEASVRQGDNVLLKITGGSLGIMQNPEDLPNAQLKKAAERPYSVFKIDPKIKNKIFFDNFKDAKGIVNRTPAVNIFNKLITLKGTNVSQNAPEVLDKMVNILVDDLTYSDNKEVSPEDRVRLFSQFTSFSQREPGYLNTKGLHLANINGKLEIQVNNNFVNTSDKEGAKAILKNHLKDAFFTYISNSKTDKLDVYDNFYIDNGILTVKEEPYREFIFKYLIPRMVYDETTGKPMIANGYFKFELDNIEEVVQKKVEEVLAKSEKIVDKKKKDSLKGLDDILGRSRLIEARATPEQKIAGDKWSAEAQILKAKDKDGKPLLTITDARDIVNSDAFATFANATVTLYKGFNSTHMYHEAWHVFSQMYLTYSERTNKLYKPASNLEGSFTVVRKFGGPGGNTAERVRVNFADLKADLESSDPDVVSQARLDLEEFIAEEFRKYAMNGGTFKVKDTKANIFEKIFKRIWDFFKALFKGSLPVNVYSHPGSNGVFSEMFNALYTAKEEKDLNMYMPSINNAEFGTLNLGIMAPNGRTLLSGIDAQLLSNSIDGIISEITTNLILGDPSEERKPRYGAALQIFANPDALAYIYNVEVKTKLTKRLNKLIEEKEKNESSWNVFERDYHINNIRVLHQGLKHFGNLNDIVKNKTAENSIVAYHLQNSAFKESIRKGITDPTDVDSTDLASYLARTMDKSGNEVASEKLATSNALYIIQSLIKQEYDKEGNVVDKLNSLGFPETIDFLPFWNFLMNKVSGEQNIEDLYNKMVSVTNIGLNPLMEQLLLKLGDPNVVGVANKNAGNIWLGILSSLNPANVDLINFVARQNKKGEYDVTVGKVSADYFKIKNSVWKNKFSTETSKYVKLDKDKENVLILDEIVKDFLDKNLDSSNTYRYSLKKNKAPIDFFNAIGLYMSSNQEVVNKIDYETINQLADAIGQAALNGAVIKNTVKYFDEVHKIYVEKLIKGKVEGVSSYLDKGQAKSYVISPLTSRINALAQLEADYSIEYGSQMKPVSGGKKSIYTLNSTLSKIMYGLRKAAGIDDLIDYNGNYGYMPHLHPMNNPALKGSVYHKNLFDKSGKKIEGAELEMFELVGAQIINEDGKMEDASHRKMTDGDTFKVNMFSFLSEGYMEAVRSAGKSTYYAARMNNIITYAYKKSNHLFIDTEAFIKNKNGEYIFGINPIKELNKIMLPKLEGELRRIVKLSEGITEEQAIELGLDPKKTDLKNFYKNNVKGFEFGDKFDWFHDILESEEGGKIKQKLISEYGPKLTDTNSIIELLEEDLEFKELIEERISTYFENYKNRLRKDYDVFYKAKQAYDSVTKQPKTILNIPSYLKKAATQHLSPSQLSTISDEAILDGLLISYAVNSGLHSDEIITIEFGDGFQFDHSKNEGPKRIPTYNSPGKIFASDNITKNILNIHYGRPYEAKLIAEGKIAKTEVRKFEKVGNKFIISEPTGATSRYDQYHDLFLTGLNKRNYTEDEIKELMYGIKDGKYGSKEKPFGGSIMDTWANIKYADGQGLISFDYYRLLHANEDNWSPAQEAAFQKEINGEFIAPQDLTELFPAYKLQHAGALATPKGMYPIQSIDKFALLPAIPSLMKDTNYEIIHNQMVAQDGDYMLFPSGSKRSHIKAGKDINGDQIYDGTTAKLKPEFINGRLKLTKNPFFVDYLKNQTEVNNYFKDESTLSTQFRKVFNTGIYENGLPIDFTGTQEEWDKLSYKKKLETSRIHRKTEAVFSRLEKLTTELKYDLLDEMGVDHVKGKFDLNPDSITNMIGYLTKKLKAQGYSDHQLSILNSENGKAPNLSLSPEAPRLEKLLMAVINNRLVRLKLFGEAYVQTSSAFFEPFTNATEEQKEIHDDFREEGGYVVDPTGKENTKGCKVKVALTDNYKNLYKTSYFIKDENGNYVNSGETIAVYDKVEGKKNKVLNEQASFNRLNEMLKVQEWKNDDSNRKKIHISGVRIPTQGPNSVEFAEIWEFLPPAAGPIIIIPREVVAKSGGDFDVDKLTMYIKRISRQGSLIEDTYKDKEAILPEIESLKNKLKELKADKLTIDNSLESFRKQVYYAFNYVEMTNEQKRNFTTRDNKSLLETLQNPENQKFLKRSIKRAYKIYNKEIKSFNVSEYEDVESIMNDLYGKNSELAKTFKKLSDLEDHSNHFSSAIGNSLVDDFIQVLELPEMAFSLLLPNGTYLVKKYSDELKEAVQLSDKQTNYQNSIQTGNKISDISAGISPTRLREVDFNRQIKQDNITGKDVLGILALDTPFNNLNNMAGTMMESSIAEEVMVFNPETNKNDIITLNTPVYLKLNHNSKEVMEAGRRLLEISLSDLTDAEKKNQIADVFNQLINGAVDVEKDPWIAYVQGNMEVIPKMVFLLQAGVPFADLAYFFTNPLTRSYVRFSKEVKSPLGQLAYGPNYSAYRLIKGFKSKYLAPAKKLVEKETTGAEDTLYELHKMLDEYTRQMPTENIFDTQNLKEVAFSSLEFSDKDIKNDIPQKQLAGFLQYLYVEKLIEDYDFMKKAINVDTNVTNTTYMAASKLRDLSKADKLKSIKKGALRFFVKEGPLRSFHVQDFALELIGDTFFPSRSNRKIDDFLLEISDRIPGQMSKLKQIEKQTGFDEESFEPRYKNALSLFAFTNALGQYKKGDVSYKGHPINELLGEGSAVTSINQIIADFDSKKYSQSYKEQDSYLNRGLYPIPLAALRNLNETDFIDINLEREYLRKYVTPFTATFVKSKEFQLTKKRLLETESPVFSKMDSESFNRLTYEFMLMHNSLLNTYNNWEMFSSGNNTVAQRLIDIVDNYGANIKPDYKVLLERFGLDSSQATEKLNARRNFYIKNIKDIEQVAGDYNGIWKKLANPSMPKLMGDSAEVAAANNYISNFFDQLPIFAFLQTGMDPGPFSMTKIMPLDKYYGIMEEATKEFNDTQLSKKENKLILESFLELFKKNNDLDIINLRGRGVSYKKTINALINEAKETVTIYSSPFVEKIGDNVYQLNDTVTDFGRTIKISDTYIASLKNAHPNATFLLTDQDFNITFNLSTPEELEQAKTNIDILMNDLKASDNPIIISSKGFGQQETQKVAVKTIKIISEADIASYNQYLAKSSGVAPAEFFTSKTKFKEFFNPETGRRENAPQTSKWELQSNGLYDLIDRTSGEIYITDVDLKTGLKTIFEKSSTQPTTNLNPAEYTNLSGGAKGGDMTWDAEGKKVGVNNHIHYTPAYYDKLSEAQKQKIEERYKTAAKFLGRNTLSETTYAGKLVRRDMIQANNGDAIFGVTELVKPGLKGRKGYNNKMSYSIPEGGTGYAVASGILLNKPVYIFNQSNAYGNEIGWYKWDSSVNDFVKTSIPTLTKNFTGIGTTEINEAGKQSIKDVYVNTFKAQPSTSVKSTIENELEKNITDELKEKVFAINNNIPFKKIELTDLNLYVKKLNNNEFSIAVDNKGKNIFGLVSAVLDFQRRDLDEDSIYIPNPKGFILWNDFLKSEVATAEKSKVIVDNRYDIAIGTLKALQNNGINSINFPERFADNFKEEYTDFLKQDFSSVLWGDSRVKTIEINIDNLINILSLQKEKFYSQAPETSNLNQELSLYLSEQLDKNLGYTNPGSVVVPSIKDIVNNMPNITQADINNKKLEC